MSDLIGFDEGDEGVLSGDIESYRGEDGVTDVLSLCWFYEDDDGNYRMGDDDTPKFKVSECHFIEGKGYVETNDYLEEKKGSPKTRLGTFVVHYDTNKKGEFKDEFDYEVKPWEFGADKFRDLKDIHKDFPLTKHDFKARCEGQKFQKLTFLPSPKDAIWQQKEEVKKDVLETVENIEDSLSLARSLPETELKEHFGDMPDPDISDDSSDEFDDFMDGI